MNTGFYHQLLRKYHIAFGSIFNNLTLLRNAAVDNSGAEAQRFVVPIEYTAREMWMSRLRQDPDLDRKDMITVPRLAYEMTDIRYDSSRKLNSLNQRLAGQYGTNDTVRRYFVGVPYLLTFKLYAITRSVEDANQIAEQVLPFFTPDYSLLVKLIPSLNILDRMRIVIDTSSPQWSDSYEEAGRETSREIILTFTFTVAATLYGPVANAPANIIRKVIVDLYDASYDKNLTGPIYFTTDSLDRLMLEDDSGRLLTEDSNGDTRDLSRTARIQIEPDPIDAAPIKPVETTTTVTDYVDGKVANPFTGEDVELDS